MEQSETPGQNSPSPKPSGGGFSWAVVLLSIVLLVQLGWLLYSFRQPRPTTGGPAPVSSGAPGFPAGPRNVGLAPTNVPPPGPPPSGGPMIAPSNMPPPPSGAPAGSPAMYVNIPQLGLGLASLTGENALTAEQIKKFRPLVEQMASSYATTQGQVIDVLKILTDAQRKALADPSMRPGILPQPDGTKDPVVAAAIDAIKSKAGGTAATPQAVDEGSLRMMPTDRWMVMNGIIGLEKTSTPLSPEQAKGILAILEPMQTELTKFREAQIKLAEGLTPAQAFAIQQGPPPNVDTVSMKLITTLMK